MSGTRKVGETDIWKNSGYARTSPHDDDWILEEADDEEIGYDDDYIGSNSSYQKWTKESCPSSTADGERTVTGLKLVLMSLHSLPTQSISNRSSTL